MKLQRLFFVCGALGSVVLFANCNDEDLGYTADEIAYRTNFEKMYGKIADDQIWDFSSYNYYTMEQANGSNSESTRASNTTYKTTFDTWIDVDPAIVKWLNENMAEKQDHSSEITEFNLAANSEFYILPIYQGQSGMMWDLYLEDQNGAQLLWQKSDDLRYKTDYSKWEEFVYTTDDSNVYSDGNKYTQVKFSVPFSKFSQRFNGDNTAKVVFNVPAVEGRNANDTYLKGSFFFTYDGAYTQINTSLSDGAFSDFFTNSDNSGNVENSGNGTFSFCASNNSTINNGSLVYAGGMGNQVNLQPLLGKTVYYNVDGEQRSQQVQNFDNLVFIISSDNWVDRDHSFYTWSGNRIRVFVKYNYTESSYTNLVTENNNNNVAYFQAHTISKNHLQTKLFKINSSAINGQFKFNLKTKSVTKGDTDAGLASVGDNHYSDEGTMNVIKFFSGANSPITGDAKTTLKNTLNGIIGSNGTPLSDNFKFWVVGCEDAKGSNCDKDYNDVVFLLIGNELPKLSEKIIIEKRYMIEDLGSTHDFDFNDIVVDVTEEVTSLEDDDHYCIKQTAKIVNLCGTIPFLVEIGGVAIGDGHFMNGRLNHTPTDVSYTKVLVDKHVQGDYKNHRIWNPSTNNIKVYVYPSKQDDGLSPNVYTTETLATSGAATNTVAGMTQSVQLVAFPQTGKLPYIIATDQTVQWMNETVSIPESWMKVKPEGYNNNGFQHGTQAYNPLGNVYEMWDLYNGVSVTFSDNYSVGVEIAKTLLNGAADGDIITVHVQNQNNEYSIGPKPDWNQFFSNNDGGNFTIKGDYELTVTTALLNAITDKLVFNGKGNTVTKVTLKHKKR